ncbi:hypothetical protein FE772_09000 [Lysobacter enzymogenes]|nr:hypothetical protein [Lysobacter enzymogenes]QCW25782.1 hypothetical protein FE772_09000 [Lysobacter enzymogenes]
MPNAKNRLTIAIALGLSGLTALAAAAAVGGLNRPAASADASVGAPALQRAALPIPPANAMSCCTRRRR